MPVYNSCVAFAIFHADAKSILSETSGFIAQAGFTHSLTPARNCGFACTYCYVPTMGIYGGLKPEDWRRWGQFTTFKANAPELLAKSLRGGEVVYCSPLVDPYQPAEHSERLMPRLLDAFLENPVDHFIRVVFEHQVTTGGPILVAVQPIFHILHGVSVCFHKMQQATPHSKDKEKPRHVPGFICGLTNPRN